MNEDTGKIWRQLETCIAFCVKTVPVIQIAELAWDFLYPISTPEHGGFLYPKKVVYTRTTSEPQMVQGSAAGLILPVAAATKRTGKCQQDTTLIRHLPTITRRQI